jgi:hypothetical protein
MRRIVITENQARLIVDKLISEQINVKTVYGGTDGQRISHAYLEKSFGLPGGSKHENYYYAANIEDVIKMSADPQNASKFLSVFTLNEKYSNKPNDFYDFIQVNDQVLDKPGSMVFKFYNGEVYAAHNGLLALSRAMMSMGGIGVNMKISFGSSTKGDEAENERIIGSVSFNSNQALNLVPAMNGLSGGFASLASSPELLKYATSHFIGKSKEEIKTIISKRINTIVQGIGGFMDNEQKDQIFKILIPKGFIMDIKYDLTDVFTKLESLSSIPDVESDGYSSKLIYNEEKKEQLNNISSTFVRDLTAKIGEAYMQNFKLYVENLLPEDKDRILPLIPKVKIVSYEIGEWHDNMFHSKFGGTIQTGSQLQQQNKKVGSGKVN